MAGAGLQASAALAAPCPANVTTALAATCEVGPAQSVTIATGGSIISAGTAIQLTGAGNKTIVNSGTLTGAPAGIQDQISGLLSSGTVTITNNAGAAINGMSSGIWINSASTLNLTNAGTIKGSSSSSAAGITVSGDLTGSITNSGTITGIANGSETDSLTATGIYIFSNVSAGSTITNTGTIRGDAQNSSVTSASAYGIYVDDDLAGTITNSGTIEATALASSSASAAGIYVSSTVLSTGTITNSGTITVSAIATSGSANAAGIFVSSTMAGTITNSGTINVTASNSSEGFAAAAGIYVSETLASGGSITNTGTINVTADGGSSSRAVGIYVSSMAFGSTLNNSGTITVTSNSNDISSSESGLPTGGAVGIFVSFLNGGATLTNSGTVTANTDAGVGTGWAMIVAAGSSSESGFPLISNSGTLRGNVILQGASLNNTGTLSIPISSGSPGTFSFISRDYTQSANGVLEIGAYDSSNYGRLVVGGTADLTASGKFAVRVDPANLLVAGEILENVLTAGTLMSGGNAHLSVTDNDPFWNFTAIDDGNSGIDLVPSGQANPVLTAQSAQVANLNLNNLAGLVMGRIDTRRLLMPDGSHDQNLWLRPFGSSGSQDDSSDVLGYDIDSYGLVLGYDTILDGSEWNVGAAVGYAQTEVESNNSQVNDKIDTDTYSLSAYGFWTGADNTYIDLLAIVGSGKNDSTRGLGINGTAKGDYDSWYSRLSSEIGRGYKMGDKLTLTPSANVAYTYVDDKGYTETGAAGLNLTVADSDAESLIFGLDGQLSYAMSVDSLLTAHIGVGYDTLTDELDVNSSFGTGAAFTTTSDSPDEWLGRAGVGAEFVASDRLEMHLNYEYEYRNDFDNNLLVGTLRWKI